LIDDGSENEVAVLGAIPTDLTVAGYFRGGKAPITYTATTVETPKTFQVKVDKDTGAITLTKAATLTATGEEYTMGDEFTVSAKDADGFTTPEGDDALVVTVKRNRPPTATGTLSGATAIVGNQDGFATDATDEQKKDVCNQLNTRCYTKVAMTEAFQNVDSETLKFSVRSKSPSHVSAAINDAGDLVVTGHEPLRNEAKAIVAVTLYLKALDGNKLPSPTEHELMITVDPMPTIESGLPSSITVESDGIPTGGVNDIAEFFTDTETLTAVLDTATVTKYTRFFDAMITGDNLVVTGKNIGSGEVVITVTEQSGAGADQWFRHTIPVNVVAPK
jgi:hypothetical protein